MSARSESAGTPSPGRAVVVGLGNPVLSDDGVGLAVATELQRLLEEAPVPGVDILASTRAGFEMIDLLRGYGRATLVDCIVLPDPQPGRVRRLRLDDVAGCARLVNAHEISVGTAIRLAEQLGVPMPERVDILAVEGGDTTTLSEAMTPPVQAAVVPLAREIYDQLRREAPASEPPDSEEFRNRRAFYSPAG